MRVEEIARGLSALEDALVSMSRMYALRLLGDGDRGSKLRSSACSGAAVELAALVREFGARQYQQRPRLMAWPVELAPGTAGTMENGRVAMGRLEVQIAGVRGAILGQIARLEEEIAGDLMTAPAGVLLRQVRSEMLEIEAGAETDGEMTLTMAAAPEGVVKCGQGPVCVEMDPIFTPEYSLLEEKVPEFCEELRETVRYLWTVGIGETMAAELCALCAIEYDGMPLSFYRDMGKQAWDEMRHAVGYVEVAIAMLPELEAGLEMGDPLRACLEQFRREGRGLTIPRELNLYETIWNCTLEERLILFQIQTEAPGASRKKRNLRTRLCAAYPRLESVLEFDLRDEISHARIGRTWLNYLIPEREERRKKIAETTLLRSVLLMTSFAHHGGGSLEGLLDGFLALPDVGTEKLSGMETGVGGGTWRAGVTA